MSTYDLDVNNAIITFKKTFPALITIPSCFALLPNSSASAAANANAALTFYVSLCILDDLFSRN